VVNVVVYENRPFKALDALVEGIPGAVKRPATEWEPCDVAVIFGTYKPADQNTWPKGEVIQKTLDYGGRVLVCERGYVRRSKYLALGWDGINGRADFCNVGVPDDRWRSLGISLKNWKRRSGPILVAGQVPWDASVQHHDHIAWCRETVAEVRRLGFEVLFRPHPVAVRKGGAFHVDGRISTNGFIKQDLRIAKAVVTFNSNTGVDAIIAGVPTIAMDCGSMVWGMAGHSLGQLADLPMPNRKAWAASLAYSQWTHEELADGSAWRHIKRGLA
jgi:hypothetical protein